MAITEDTLAYINYFISVYVGYFIVITGLIGNIINLLIFTQLKLFRDNQFAFYLTVASTVDSGQLILSMATRVTTTIYGYDPARTSLIWCRFRTYFNQLLAVISATTVCFAAIDQYLSTSHHIQLRQMSTFKLARRLVGVLIIFAASYSITFPVFYDIRANSTCAISNPVFTYYYSFVHLCILLGIVPVIISFLFSLFAYHNVRRIVRRHMPIVRRRLDHQLTAMILVRVALLIVTTLPYVSVRMYQIIDPVDQNNTYAVAVDSLIRIAFIMLNNINYSVIDFYFIYL
jgi:hypothetical protein